MLANGSQAPFGDYSPDTKWGVRRALGETGAGARAAGWRPSPAFVKGLDLTSTRDLQLGW